jgi:hypothetical protein
MQGRSTFSKSEADEIRQILREKATADRSRQKSLRGTLRSRYHFFISDFTNDAAGFTALDFDQLVRAGAIKVEGRRTNQLDLPGIDLSILEDDPTPPPEGRGTRESTAVGSDEAEGAKWYDELRSAHRPEVLRFLLVAESPPDPGSSDRRFFYSPTLATHDNLYRGVAEAVYRDEPAFDVRRKAAVLERLRADGYWLIDAVPTPINRSSDAARRKAIREAATGLVERCRELAPKGGIIICHTVVYTETAAALRGAGLNLLHDEPIPFPLGNWRAEFVRRFRQAIGKATR